MPVYAIAHSSKFDIKMSLINKGAPFHHEGKNE